MSEQIHQFYSIYNELKNEDNSADTSALEQLFHTLSDADKKLLYADKDRLGYTLLLEAAYIRNEGLAVCLVNLGFDVNASNVNGKSVLIIAVQNNMYGLIDLLLEKGVDVDYARTRDRVHGSPKVGPTALMVACEKGMADVVEKILAKNPDINYTTDLKQSALLFCTHRAPGNFECFKLLMEQEGIIHHRRASLGVHVFERIIKFCDKDFLNYALHKGVYNDEVYKEIYSQAYNPEDAHLWRRDPGKNSLQEVREHLEYIEKFNSRQELHQKLLEQDSQRLQQAPSTRVGKI